MKKIFLLITLSFTLITNQLEAAHPNIKQLQTILEENAFTEKALSNEQVTFILELFTSSNANIKNLAGKVLKQLNGCKIKDSNDFSLALMNLIDALENDDLKAEPRKTNKREREKHEEKNQDAKRQKTTSTSNSNSNHASTNQLTTVYSNAQPDWTELPPELLVQISDFLLSPEPNTNNQKNPYLNIRNFKLICKKFNNSRKLLPYSGWNQLVIHLRNAAKKLSQNNFLTQAIDDKNLTLLETVSKSFDYVIKRDNIIEANVELFLRVLLKSKAVNLKKIFNKRALQLINAQTVDHEACTQLLSMCLFYNVTLEPETQAKLMVATLDGNDDHQKLISYLEAIQNSILVYCSSLLDVHGHAFGTAQTYSQELLELIKLLIESNKTELACDAITFGCTNKMIKDEYWPKQVLDDNCDFRELILEIIKLYQDYLNSKEFEQEQREQNKNVKRILFASSENAQEFTPTQNKYLEFFSLVLEKYPQIIVWFDDSTQEDLKKYQEFKKQ